MSICEGNIRDEAGNPVIGASVYIYTALGALASLTDEFGSPIVNPVETNIDGYYSAYVADGTYTIKVVYGGRERLIETGKIVGTPSSLPVFVSSFGAMLVAAVNAAAARILLGILSAAEYAASSGSSLIGFVQSGTGAVARTAQSKIRETVSVTDFMGILSTTAAIQAAINAAGSELHFPDGTYTVTSELTLKSGLKITASPGAKIVQGAGIAGYILRGANLSDICIRDITIEGNGLASGDSAIYLSGCTNVLISNVTVTKARSIGVWITTSSNVKVEYCDLSNNYAYGLEFRDCANFKAIGNTCAFNGDTGVATSTGGRGIMVWRCNDGYIAGNTLSYNSEYGFRIYSEAADVVISYNIKFIDNTLVDNTRCDVVLYDEGSSSSFVTRNSIKGNYVYRTTNPDLGCALLLHGDYNDYEDNHVYKDGTFGTFAAFNFYNANNCSMAGMRSSATNTAVAISTSSCTNIEIDNFFGNGVANALTVPTEGIKVRNSTFIHGGSGTTDTAINNTATATGKNYYENNVFENFNIAIRAGNEAIALYRNKTTGGAIGLQKDNASISDWECGDNDWHSCNRNDLYALSKAPNDIAYSADYALPSVINYPLDARFAIRGASVGNPYEYVKTGTNVGDWTSVGNL